MSDTLKQLGKSIGRTGRDVRFLQRRGGFLPQLDRTRGFLRTTLPFIAPFVVNESSRRLSVTIDFTEGT